VAATPYLLVDAREFVDRDFSEWQMKVNSRLNCCVLDGPLSMNKKSEKEKNGSVGSEMSKVTADDYKFNFRHLAFLPATTTTTITQTLALTCIPR
jgi:hypothetical protein